MAAGHPDTVHGSAERQPWELYALISFVIAQSALVIMGNVPQLSPWLLALLAIGIGQALLLSPAIAWLGGLTTAVLWVLLRLTTGIWVQQELLQNVMELIGLGANVALAIRYKQVWQRQQKELLELRELRQLLVAGEVGSGLLPPNIAGLRMAEEIDRAKQFRRPLALLLIELSKPSQGAGDVDRETYQAVARQLASVSLLHDIPFRVSDRRFGLLLPERDRDKLYADAEVILSAVRKALFRDPQGRPRAALDHVRMDFGLGVYNGETEGEVDLMRAAEDSLAITRDFADIGDAPISTYAMPATPFAEVASALPGEEV